MILSEHKNNFYDRFGTIIWLHHKIINGWLVAFWCNSDGVKHLGYIIRRATPHKKVLGENMTWSGGVQKGSKLKPISHCYRRP